MQLHHQPILDAHPRHFGQHLGPEKLGVGGIGLAAGYATLGNIGFEGRMDYGAIGNVTNLAARLCGEAMGGQILVDRKTLGRIEELVEVEPRGELTLKGFPRPVAAFNILKIK